MTPEVQTILFALVIFGLRVLNYAISTIRMVVIARQRRLLASVLAFFEALIFAVVIAEVVTDLSNIVNLIAYCAGAAVGSYLGIVLEGRFITSYRTINIITHDEGHAIALALREHGYGVTETLGEGLTGQVTMLRSVVNNHDLARVLYVIRDLNPDAFIAIEEARAVQHGYLRDPGRFR